MNPVKWASPQLRGVVVLIFPIANRATWPSDSLLGA
jgi:hypothetical protein